MAELQELYENLDIYGLGAAPHGNNKARSYAFQPDAEMLRNLRGHSLDTLTSIQRHLAGLPSIGQVEVQAVFKPVSMPSKAWLSLTTALAGPRL